MQPKDILDRESIRRIVADKIRHDLRAGGTDDGCMPPWPWTDGMAIGTDGIGADSLDLLALAGGINQMFHLHRTGIEDLLLARRTLGGWVDLVAQSWAQNAEALTFLTSGSTFTPKPCMHSTHHLIAEAREHVERLRPRRVLAAVPAHHIYGFLFTVLVPAIAGVPVIDIRAGLADAEPIGRGDLLVSYPEHWRYFAQSREQLPPVTGVSSTAPMPAALARQLRAQGLARLVEIYGASETAGIGWREKNGAPYALLDIWAQAAHGEDGALLLTRADGHCVITPDAVRMAGPRGIAIVKRLDSAIQVGGINVFPGRVAAVLETHPDVARAQVGVGGGRLRALLVVKNPAVDRAALGRSLHLWIRQTLAAPERPRSLRFVAAFPHESPPVKTDWLEAPLVDG